MGSNESDKCLFCGNELEVWEYEYFVENGERASQEYDENLDLCKGCAIKLKKILNKVEEIE